MKVLRAIRILRRERQSVLIARLLGDARIQILELKPEKLILYSLTTNEAVESTRDAKSLKEAREKIAEVADQIRAREFPARPGFGCRFCDYRPICPAHEQLISIRGSVKDATTIEA